MAIISSNSIIRTISLFHISMSYFLITSPSTIAKQSLVFILGAAMELPTPLSFELPSASNTFLALALILFSITDLTACSLPEEISSYFWGNQAPIRCTFFFLLTGSSYALKPGGPVKSSSAQPSPWDHLNNSVVFTWGFLEMICWFWIFITLREERRELSARRAEKKQAEENML